MHILQEGHSGGTGWVVPTRVQRNKGAHAMDRVRDWMDYVTLALAGWGAVLSTLLAIRTILVDRPRLRLTAWLEVNKISNTPLSHSYGVVVLVSNRGQRGTQIQQIGYQKAVSRQSGPRRDRTRPRSRHGSCRPGRRYAFWSFVTLITGRTSDEPALPRLQVVATSWT